ncbi:MAG: AEC family transporter [Pseudomonadota bacterium]
MGATLADPILPIFAILAIGFVAGRRGWFDEGFARTLNRFVFLIGQPTLVFFVIARAEFGSFDWTALGAYLGSELAVYALGAVVARTLFGRELREALLLGMTCAFVNHLYYVLPIVELIFGAEAARPVAGVIVVDVVLLYCGTVLVMDLLDAERADPASVVRLLARSPTVLAVLAGAGAAALGGLTPPGVFTFAEFVGRAAPPVSLLALGIVMAAAPLARVGGATLSIVGIKVLVHPLIALGLLSLAAVPADWADVLLIVAAGPCGAMPFVIALQYGVKTETIAKAILISTVLTLLSLSVLTA